MRSCFTVVRYCQGLITSTVHNHDIVSTLSLGVLRDLKTMASGLSSEGHMAEHIVGRVIGIHQRRFMANRSSAPASKGTAPPMASRGDDRGAATSMMDVADEAREVPFSNSEFDAGKGKNRAMEPSYTDPSLVETEVSDDAELNDWLWSLIKTVRAGNDNEKLYPPGTSLLW